MSEAKERFSYARDVLGVLFPGAAVATGDPGHDGNHTRTFALAPSARRPRLLVPVRPRDAAATALRGYGGRLDRRTRWKAAALTATLATAGPAVLRHRMTVTTSPGAGSSGIDGHLSDVVGREVSIAVHLTPSRANRKPIVQSIAPGEPHPLAFSKVAVDPLTNRLIEREAATLSALSERAIAGLVVPTVTDLSRFVDHQVLTMTPLPTWLAGRSPSLTDVVGATAAVESLSEPTHTSLQDSAFWQDVQQRSRELPETPRAQRLQQCVEALGRQLGPREIQFTASHGDWSPWNMWLTSRGLLVWDWERFDSETPQGFDLLHFRLNDQLVRGRWSLAETGHRLIAGAAEVLALGAGSDPALPTALLYLLSLGLRYEADQQLAAGAAIGRLESWLLPALEAGLADPALARHR